MLQQAAGESPLISLDASSGIPPEQGQIFLKENG